MTTETTRTARMPAGCGKIQPLLNHSTGRSCWTLPHETGTCPGRDLCRSPGGTKLPRSSSDQNRPGDTGNGHDRAQQNLARCNRWKCVDGTEVYELQAPWPEDCHRPRRSRYALLLAPLLHLPDAEPRRKDLDSSKARCCHANLRPPSDRVLPLRFRA